MNNGGMIELTNSNAMGMNNTNGIEMKSGFGTQVNLNGALLNPYLDGMRTDMNGINQKQVAPWPNQ
jgi:hypothetical protein